jgi:K+-sensing histidine kinase KdpD
VGELQRASDLLKERGEGLQTAYEQAQAGDRMKTNFLYNMSDQMTSPVSDICKCVMTISDRTSELSEEETNRLVDEIQQRGEKITALLNQLIAESERIMGN